VVAYTTLLPSGDIQMALSRFKMSSEKKSFFTKDLEKKFLTELEREVSRWG
jgi:hypothetical protein